MAVNDDDEAPAGALDSLMPRFQGAYQDIYKKMQDNATAKQAAQQSYLSALQQQEGPLSQTGMSDLDKAAMWAQAAGAFGAPTRSGGFTETLANVGTTLSGPLSKQAEIQRARSQQLQQLQLARQKLGMEMAGAGGVDPMQAMQLLKAQQDQEEEKRTPNADEIIASQLKPEDRPAFWRTKAGLDKPAEKKKDVSDTTLQIFTEGGSAISDLDTLKTQFKPDFAGKYLMSIGEIQNAAGKKGVLPQYSDQAKWWSDYQERKNVLRNGLFGSAVTKPELAEFLKADITEDTDPKLIQDKLDKQREAARKAAYKLANAKELQGFDVAPIEAALGFKLKDLEKPATAKSAESGGKTVARTGTVNSGPNAGKRVILYSDGTREYQ
jgi:hypothetical protein